MKSEQVSIIKLNIISITNAINSTETVIFGTSHKYPTFSTKGLLSLFKLLDLDKIIFLFECILLEKKLFIISKYKSVIT